MSIESTQKQPPSQLDASHWIQDFETCLGGVHGGAWRSSAELMLRNGLDVRTGAGWEIWSVRRSVLT